MGQGKQPAACVSCGVVGPLRTVAPKAGWVRLGRGTKPCWACPASNQRGSVGGKAGNQSGSDVFANDFSDFRWRDTMDTVTRLRKALAQV